jgi:predicted transcriptional regulator
MNRTSYEMNIRASSVQSRYSDLRELLQRSVTVRYIAGFELVTCQANEPTEEARARMEQHGFDMLPMVTDGRILGYVERVGLGSGLCWESEQRLALSDLVSESTSVLDLLPILRDLRAAG